MNTPIRQLFKTLGLSEKEASVYASLFRSNLRSANSIHKTTKLPRTLVYHILKKLVALGLVNAIKNSGPTLYNVESPDKLYAMLASKQKDFECTKKDLLELIPKIKEQFRQVKSLADIRFFEGVLGYKQVLEEIIKDKPKEIYIYGHTESILFPGIEARKKFFNRIKFNKITVKILLTEQSNEAYNDYIQYRKIKSEKITDKSHLFIFNDKLVHVLLKDRDVICFIVEQNEFVETQKHLFQSVWDNSQDITI